VTIGEGKPTSTTAQSAISFYKESIHLNGSLWGMVTVNGIP